MSGLLHADATFSALGDPALCAMRYTSVNENLSTIAPASSTTSE